ncbi:MAG: RNase adapter RapZ [Nakamurella sp.]
MTESPSDISAVDAHSERVSNDRGGIEVAIVSGLSGAGRSTAAKCLEDLGWFVVDNLPAELIQTMVDLGARSRGAVTRIAVVVDVRSRAFTEDLAMVIRDLDSAGYRPRVLFLEADDASLIRRYEANRRQHPLQGAGRISDGLAAERALLGPLRDEADVVIDTTSTSVHDLRRRIETDFTAAPRSSTLTVVSFGFKYGLPLDADLVIDMRFLPNPFWIPELRELTGLDPAVSDYVLTQEGATEFLDRWLELFQLTGGGYQREGKRYLTVAVGCTGGKHRSVATAEEIGRRLRAGQQSAAVGEASDIRVSHRDLGRE